jgi:hypothetical protein
VTEDALPRILFESVPDDVRPLLEDLPGTHPWVEVDDETYTAAGHGPNTPARRAARSGSRVVHRCRDRRVRELALLAGIDGKDRRSDGVLGIMRLAPYALAVAQVWRPDHTGLAVAERVAS